MHLVDVICSLSKWRPLIKSTNLRHSPNTSFLSVLRGWIALSVDAPNSNTSCVRIYIEEYLNKYLLQFSFNSKFSLAFILFILFTRQFLPYFNFIFISYCFNFLFYSAKISRMIRLSIIDWGKWWYFWRTSVKISSFLKSCMSKASEIAA